MSGVDGLQARIIEDAKIQAEKNLREAEEQASGIIDQASRDADSTRKGILEDANKKAVQLKERLTAIARLDSKKRILETKQKIIEKAFDEASLKLASMPLKEYENIMLQMLVAAIQYGDEEIIFNKQDRQRLGDQFIKTLKEKLLHKGIKNSIVISENSGDFKGGFILKRGNIQTDARIETIIKIMKRGLQSEVADVLF